MTPSGVAARALSRRGLLISGVALLGLAGVYVLALGYTPVEARQGVAQKIFYLHVPAAWNALMLRSKLVLGIADGWLSADGNVIYKAPRPQGRAVQAG